jgi:hypothetical protein
MPAPYSYNFCQKAIKAYYKRGERKTNDIIINDTIINEGKVGEAVAW